MQMTITTSKNNTIQVIRNDSMFVSGRGVIVMWPVSGVTYIPATGNNSGLGFLLQITEKLGYSNLRYKIINAYDKVMSAKAYEGYQVNITVA